MTTKTRKVARVSRAAFNPSSFPGDGSLADIYAELLAYPNVHGCYIGRKTTRPTKDGKKQNVGHERLDFGPLAVICCVDEKVPTRKLDTAHRLPRRIRWPRTRSKHFNIPIDVQVAQRGRTLATPVVGPGDDLQASAAARSGRATLGIALQHPTFGRVVTTAGHAFLPNAGNVVFGTSAPMLTIANAGGTAPAAFQARPLKATRRPDADYALLQSQAESRNLYRDALSITGVHLARPEDHDTKLFALTRTGVRQTILHGITGVLEFDGLKMTGLLYTDDVTDPGDSGCCLVDKNVRVWGLLVGNAVINNVTRSVFASANSVLENENAQLA